MLELQTIIHYSAHFLVPGVIAWFIFPLRWKIAWGIMLLTMAVDLDHLLANPIFDPSRCGIGFHPLHSYLAIGFYFLLLLFPNIYIRIIATGLLLHMFADFQDCLWIAASL